MKTHIFLFAAALAIAPIGAYAAVDYDILIPSGGITTDHSTVLLGQTAKIYVTVDNAGTVDTEGTAMFSDDGVNIGMKAVSAKANGKSEEVWLSWKPEILGQHTISVKLIPDSNVTDPSPANNERSISILVDKDTDNDGIGDSVDPDTDGDGTSNGQDQFPLDPNMTKDTDHDGIDDSKDSDIDNDGLYNWDETKIGTDPTKYDTDGDGVGDKEDVYPLDPNRSKAETLTSGSSGSSGSSESPGSSGTSGATSPSNTAATNSADGSLASVSSGFTNTHENGRVLAAEDFAAPDSASSTNATTADERVSTTTLMEDVSAQALADLQPEQQNQEPIKTSFGLTTFLWIIAIICGLLAALFAWLSRKKKDETR
ncbi:MAG: thrombospondin type 3 repeat-containing protein [Patescibacteria group bacterium]|nr:thrombospondin type 3 repeat-containing protein [Patescibacteria group bacterium]